jgi:hypothetical protein
MGRRAIWISLGTILRPVFARRNPLDDEEAFTRFGIAAGPRMRDPTDLS